MNDTQTLNCSTCLFYTNTITKHVTSIRTFDGFNRPNDGFDSLFPIHCGGVYFLELE